MNKVFKRNQKVLVRYYLGPYLATVLWVQGETCVVKVKGKLLFRFEEVCSLVDIDEFIEREKGRYSNWAVEDQCKGGVIGNLIKAAENFSR